MSPTLPILYSFRRCPYAMRARMALSVSGQVLEHREVDLKQRPEQLIAVSPKATVPVVVLADGTVLEESIDVMRWALAQHDPEGWLPSTEEDRATTEALIARNDGDFKQHLDRYKYATRYDDVDPLEHRTAASAILSELDHRLRSGTYLLGDRFTFADAALAPFVRQFAFADKAWFDSFLSSERFLGIMHKHPVWAADASGA